MKTLIMSACLLAVAATSANAQYAPFRRELFPYAERRHDECQDKAHRLFEFERRAASDGRIDGRERRIIFELKRDLDLSCGRYRFRG